MPTPNPMPSRQIDYPLVNFQNRVREQSLQLLRTNRARLDAEQQKYLKETNPNSKVWQQLWQLAAQRRDLERQEQELKANLTRLASDRAVNMAPVDANGKVTPESRAAWQRKNKEREAKRRSYEEQIAALQRQRTQMEYAFPALAAVRGETGQDPQDLRAIQQRLPGEFDGIRGKIDGLSRELNTKPSSVLMFDAVVTAQLQDKSLSTQERERLQHWVEVQRSMRQTQGQVMGAMSGGLFIASFFPPTAPYARALQIGGAALGVGAAATEIPDLVLMDAIAQANRATKPGQQPLTSQSKDDARFNLIMGWTNVILAGVDVGMETKAIQRLAGAAGQIGVTLSRVQWSDGLKAAGQGADSLRSFLATIKNYSAEAKAKLEREFLAAISGRGSQLQPAVVPGGALDEANVNRPLQSTGTGGGNTQKKLKDMTPAERATLYQQRYGNAANWAQIQPLLDQPITRNTQLPPGYFFYEKPSKRGPRTLFILRDTTDDGNFVPLFIDGGVLRAGKERLSRGSDVMKRNLRAAGVAKPRDWQINHLIPDAVAQSDPMMIELLRRDAYDVDDAVNLLPMPGEAAARQANPNLLGHMGSHGNYNQLVRRELFEERRRLIRRYGSLDRVPTRELQEAAERVQSNMRQGIINRDPNIPTRYDQNTGTRVLSEGIPDPENTDFTV
jgi:hypothetical protein